MNKLILSGVAALTVAFALPAMAQDEKPDRPHPKGPRPDMKEKIFEKLDVDNSGGISLKEMQDEALQRAKERFDKMDVDKSGEVSKDELKPPMREHRGQGGPGHKRGKGGPDADDAPEGDTEA